MIFNRLLRNKVKDLAIDLTIQQDLYKQVSDNRDHWKLQTQRALDQARILTNKLRDETELCDELAEYLNFVITNHKHINDMDIKRGKTIMKIYKEARYAK